LILLIFTAIFTNLTVKCRDVPVTKKLRRIPLSDVEKGQILAWIDGKRSLEWIGKKLNRNRSTIHTFLMKFRTFGTTDTLPRSGRPRVTSATQDVRLVNHALLSIKRKEKPTIESIKADCDLKHICRLCQNEDDLFKTLEKAWKNISLNMLQSLIDSMPRRMEAVIEAKGYPTKYLK